MLLDLLGPPGRRSGCRPHDGEVAAGAISFSRNCCSPIPVRGDDGARAVGASIDHEAAAAPAASIVCAIPLTLLVGSEI
jgi:hypothetical protein